MTLNEPSFPRLPAWIVVAAFGPYISTSLGLRTEHLVIYGALPIALLIVSAGRRSLLGFAPVKTLLWLFSVITLWTAVVTVAGSGLASLAGALSYVENFVQPIALLIVVSVLSTRSEPGAAVAALRSICFVLSVLLAMNTLVVGAQLATDVSGFLAYFVAPGAGGGASVADAAFQNGRILGIFNQPVESGLSYALGLLAWSYRVRTGGKVSLLDFVLLAMMLVGGFFSISKVFIMGGLPLFVFHWLSLSRLQQLLNWRVLVIGAVASLILGPALAVWKGWLHFSRDMSLIAGIGTDPANFLRVIFRGRFGGGGVSGAFSYVWQEAAVGGLGFGALHLMDNAFLEFFGQGGLVALVGYVLILASLGATALGYLTRRSEEGRLLVALFILVLGGGLGAPVLTLNRFSTMYWVVLLLTYAIIFARFRTEVALSRRGESLVYRPRSPLARATGAST